MSKFLLHQVRGWRRYGAENLAQESSAGVNSGRFKEAGINGTGRFPPEGGKRHWLARPRWSNRSLCFSAFLCFFVLAALGARAEGRTFNPQADIFSFSNELYFDYKPTQSGDISFTHRAPGKTPDYSRHCFILARSVLQFYKFAEFRPDLKRVSDGDYYTIVKRLSRIPAWSSGPRQKIEIPGYTNLHDFSAAHTLLMQKELGLWWASFWRVGNWRIVFPVPRSGQKNLAEWLKKELDASRIHAIYITRFKPMNHCLVAYEYAAEPNGDLVFNVYDPNQPGKMVHLTYQSSSRSFFFDKTWYYKGGLVTALKLYVSPVM